METWWVRFAYPPYTATQLCVGRVSAAHPPGCGNRVGRVTVGRVSAAHPPERQQPHRDANKKPSPGRGFAQGGTLRHVLQKLLQARAWRVLDQRLRVAIFGDAAFVDKDQARGHFLGKADFVGHDNHRHAFLGQILHHF